SLRRDTLNKVGIRPTSDNGGNTSGDPNRRVSRDVLVAAFRQGTARFATRVPPGRSAVASIRPSDRTCRFSTRQWSILYPEAAACVMLGTASRWFSAYWDRCFCLGCQSNDLGCAADLTFALFSRPVAPLERRAMVHLYSCRSGRAVIVTTAV